MRHLLCVIACACAVAPLHGAGDGHTIDWYTIDGGGGISDGAGLECSGTFGQADATVRSMAGGNFLLEGGFWLTGAPPACPPDVNNDGVVDFTDILSLLAAWGPCGNCPQDVDEDGWVDFTDLLIVLAAWGPCPN